MKVKVDSGWFGYRDWLQNSFHEHPEKIEGCEKVCEIGPGEGIGIQIYKIPKYSTIIQCEYRSGLKNFPEVFVFGRNKESIESTIEEMVKNTCKERTWRMEEIR